MGIEARAKRSAAALLLSSWAVAALSGCGAKQEGQEVAWVAMTIKPQSARVEVDDTFFASATLLAKTPKALSPGPHLVTITAEGYFPHDFPLNLKPGTTRLHITLRKVPR